MKSTGERKRVDRQFGRDRGETKGGKRIQSRLARVERRGREL